MASHGHLCPGMCPGFLTTLRIRNPSVGGGSAHRRRNPEHCQNTFLCSDLRDPHKDAPNAIASVEPPGKGGMIGEF